MSDTPLPDSWRMASLAELGEVNRGRSRHRPRYADHLYGGPYPFIQTGDIRTSGGRITSHSTTYSEAGLAQSRLWPAGTMCITIAANIAETAILTYPSCFPDSVVGFIADSTRADVRFVEYAFRLLKRRLQQEAMGSVQDNINLEILSRLRLPIPSLAEQCAIAAVLGSLDDKIEQNRRTGAKLEGLARAVFKAWFVDFEPVKAKAAGATAFPGMPPETFAALPNTFQDSPLGPVPQGWEVGKLGENADINKNSVKSGGIEGEIEYIDIASVAVGQLSGVQQVAFADAPGRARRRVHHGDTIWSCVRPNRRSYLFIHSPPANRIASTGFAVISPKVLGAAYIYEATTRQEFVDYLVANADGSAYPAVRAEHFARADVLVPPKSVRDSFEQVVMPLRDLVAGGARESAKLAALRDYLLPRLLSGRVRVRGEIT